MPYLAMRDTREVAFGRARVWNYRFANEYLPDAAIRERVKLLLMMYRDAGRRPAKTFPIDDIGILAVGSIDQRDFNGGDLSEVRTLQRTLFLCCLADNVRHAPSTSGHYLRTAENFDVVRQTFGLEGDSVSMQAGTIVSMNRMGYKIGETVFSRPAHVPHPIQFGLENTLLEDLRKVRRGNGRLFRQIMEASEVFRASYYNAETLSISARVLLQAAAFEILLDLPEKEPRRVFKDMVEEKLRVRGERKYRYKYQVHSSKRMESRTIKGIWADRFYTLRNRLIHGQSIRSMEYTFRGLQHHLVIAPMVFTSLVKKIIDDWLPSVGKMPTGDTKLVWESPRPPRYEWDEEVQGGFRIKVDWGGTLHRYQAKQAGLRGK